jgi:hypothetical protein
MVDADSEISVIRKVTLVCTQGVYYWLILVATSTTSTSLTCMQDDERFVGAGAVFAAVLVASAKNAEKQ